jgi:hypothetical protein
MTILLLLAGIVAGLSLLSFMMLMMHTQSPSGDLPNSSTSVRNIGEELRVSSTREPAAMLSASVKSPSPISETLPAASPTPILDQQGRLIDFHFVHVNNSL